MIDLIKKLLIDAFVGKPAPPATDRGMIVNRILHAQMTNHRNMMLKPSSYSI